MLEVVLESGWLQFTFQGCEFDALDFDPVEFVAGLDECDVVFG